MYINLKLVDKCWTFKDVTYTVIIIADRLARYGAHLTAEHTYLFCEIPLSASKLRIYVFLINKE